MKKTILSIIVLFLIFISSSTFAIGATANQTMSGLNTAASQGYNGTATNEDGPKGVQTSIPGLIGTVVGAALSFIGVIFFILMIYGGFIWMFARGNEQDVTKAKELIEAAIIGLIIVLSAYAITAWLGTTLTS